MAKVDSKIVKKSRIHPDDEGSLQALERRKRMKGLKQIRAEQREGKKKGSRYSYEMQQEFVPRVGQEVE